MSSIKSTPNTRKVWDAVAKRELANQILDGEVTVADAKRLRGVQGYQLWAWIGQAAVARAEAQKKHKTVQQFSKEMGTVGRKFTAEDMLAFMEWYQHVRRPPAGE